MQKDNSKILDFTKPNIMGILNVTPDSFSDGNRYTELDKALFKAESMLQDGANIIDVGGESTRPYASFVSLQQELDRVIPVVEKLVSNFDAIISVDTSKAEVMQEVLALGVDIINDVRALTSENTIQVVAKFNPKVILMHMLDTPSTMQKLAESNSVYENVVSDIKNYLEQRVAACLEHGIDKENIILDPGFGFGKTFEDNAYILNNLDSFLTLGCPLAVGMSRKSMIAHALGEHFTIDKRLIPSIALAVMSFLKGASIIRVHDVKPTFEALTMIDRVQKLTKFKD